MVIVETLLSSLRLPRALTEYLLTCSKTWHSQYHLLSTNYSDSTMVTRLVSVKYLGVTITSDLKWNTHITNTCKSAKQKLGLLYRNFQLADLKTLSQLYKALVLPRLDYCSCIWDPPPPSITLSNKLESIQGFAAKLCTKRWSVPSTLLTSDLNCPILYSCRSRQKVLLCRRIIRNESIIPPSSYFHPLLILILGLTTLT